MCKENEFQCFSGIANLFTNRYNVFWQETDTFFCTSLTGSECIPIEWKCDHTVRLISKVFIQLHCALK